MLERWGERRGQRAVGGGRRRPGVTEWGLLALPASDLTLTGRMETAIRARCPWLAGFEADSGSSGPVRRWLLPLTPVRSR